MDELERLIELSEFNLDYTKTDPDLEDLTRLAARISGAELSLINLVDRYTQWTVAGHGGDLKPIQREESICQYTIKQDGALEVKELKNDPRFKDKDYVCAGPKLNYYYGVPLVTSKGAKLGALCVLNKENLELSEEQSKLLENVAQLVVDRLESIRRIQHLKGLLNEARKSKRKVGHDVRGPVAGILGLVELLREEFQEQNYSEVDKMLTLVKDSGESVLELVESILGEDARSASNYTCESLAEKLEELYAPKALSKKIKLSVEYDESDLTDFPPKALLQIGGNLVNNALKFTSEGGHVTVRVFANKGEKDLSEYLDIEVEDDGVGMSKERINEILQGRAESETGTVGERGFGLGLPLVRELVEKEKGSLELRSKEGEGCKFTVHLPI